MARVVTTPHVAAALEYCENVSAGRVVVCNQVRLAVARHYRDMERFKAKDAPFYFDADAAERVCAAVEHFPHIKGLWATHHKKIQLEGWQAFVLVSAFG